MMLFKCDKCGKEISETEKTKAVIAGVGYERHELCAKCGEPIARILKRYKLAELK